MVKLIIFTLVAYGASNIMIYGSIFEGWRKMWGVDKDKPGFFGKLFGCFMCLSFWWGLILSFSMYSPSLSTGLLHDLQLFGLHIDKNILSLFFDACLASGSVWLVHNLEEMIENYQN